MATKGKKRGTKNAVPKKLKHITADDVPFMLTKIRQAYMGKVEATLRPSFRGFIDSGLSKEEIYSLFTEGEKEGFDLGDKETFFAMWDKLEKELNNPNPTVAFNVASTAKSNKGRRGKSAKSSGTSEAVLSPDSDTSSDETPSPNSSASSDVPSSSESNDALVQDTGGTPISVSPPDAAPTSSVQGDSSEMISSEKDDPPESDSGQNAQGDPSQGQHDKGPQDRLKTFTNAFNGVSKEVNGKLCAKIPALRQALPEWSPAIFDQTVKEIKERGKAIFNKAVIPDEEALRLFSLDAENEERLPYWIDDDCTPYDEIEISQGSKR